VKEKIREGAEKVSEHARHALGVTPFSASKGRGRIDNVVNEVQAHLAEELATYPKKDFSVAFWAWLLTGWFGGHRFYMEKPLTGALMAISSGGFFIWWIIDFFQLRKMVEAFNSEQDRRQKEGLPPIRLGFIPSVYVDFTQPPPWHKKETRAGLKGVIFDAAMLMLFAAILAGFASGTDRPEPVVAALVTLVLIVFLDRLLPWFHKPIIHEIIHLDYKLRLFYYFNEPGSTFKLILRPVFGIYLALFQKKARAEVKLYFEICTAFAAFFLFFDLISGEIFEIKSIRDLIEKILKSLLLNFLGIYMFVGPIGATLTKHVLIKSSKTAINFLAIVTFLGMVLSWLSND